MSNREKLEQFKDALLKKAIDYRNELVDSKEEDRDGLRLLHQSNWIAGLIVIELLRASEMGVSDQDMPSLWRGILKIMDRAPF